MSFRWQAVATPPSLSGNGSRNDDAKDLLFVEENSKDVVHIVCSGGDGIEGDDSKMSQLRLATQRPKEFTSATQDKQTHSI